MQRRSPFLVAFEPPPLPGSTGLPIQFEINTTDEALAAPRRRETEL